MTLAERNLISELAEKLAVVEHERWAHWQKFVHESGIRQNDGSILLTKELVDRWERQIATSYDNLTEREKESDREQVRKYLPLILSTLRQLNKKV